MAITVLQDNINHCRKAQDLFLHDLAAVDGGMGMVVEPLSTNHPNWAADVDDSVWWSP